MWPLEGLLQKNIGLGDVLYRDGSPLPLGCLECQGECPFRLPRLGPVALTRHRRPSGSIGEAFVKGLCVGAGGCEGTGRQQHGIAHEGLASARCCLRWGSMGQRVGCRVSLKSAGEAGACSNGVGDSRTRRSEAGAWCSEKRQH